MDAHFRSPGLLAIGFFATLASGTLLTAQLQPSANRVDLASPLSTAYVGRDGDTLHVVGTDSGGPLNVRYARSLDGGRSWPLQGTVLAANTTAESFAVAGDRIFVAYGAGVTSTLVASFDRGNTWQPPIALPNGARTPQIHADGNVVHVLSIGSALSSQGVFLIRSTDGGTTWSAPVDLAAGLPTGSTTTDSAPRVVVDGAAMHLFWNRRTPLLHLVHQRSLDGGATWLPTGRSIANAPLVAACSANGRLLVQASSTLWGSTNQGTTWSPLPGHGLAYPVALAADGAEALAVEVAAASQGGLLRIATSADSGLTWSVAATTFAGSPGWSADAHVVGDTMFVRHYRPEPGGTGAVVIEQSDDHGLTWRTIVGSAHTAFLPGRDGGIVLTQFANSVGTWAWVLEGHVRAGNGNAGTGGIVPTIAGRGLAGIGRTFRSELANARGGSLAAFAFGSAAYAGVLLGAHTRLLILQPTGSLAISTTSTTGAPGQAGVGTAAHAVTVPYHTSFIGMQMACQAFVLDPGAPDGFCATAACETRIR